MAVNLLMITAITTLLFQKSQQRLLLASFYVLINTAHLLLFTGLDGSSYYLVSALFDLLIMTSVSAICIPQTLSIQKLCIISITANFAGWLMWYLYLDPTAYNAVFIAIYIYAIMILTSRDKSNVGDSAGDWSGIRFLGDSSASVKNLLSHKGSM